MTQTTSSAIENKLNDNCRKWANLSVLSQKQTSLRLSSTRNLVEIHERVPQGVLGQDARVPNNDAPEASTGKGHVKPARIRKETDALVLVGSVL